MNDPVIAYQCLISRSLVWQINIPKNQTQERVGNVCGFCDAQVKTPWHERQAQVCDHPFSADDATDAVFTLPEKLPHGTKQESGQCVLCCKLLTDITTDATL